MREIKDKRIQIRLTQEEYLTIQENLIDKGFNVSQLTRDFLMELATGEPKYNEDKIKQILNEEEVINYLCNIVKRRLN